MLRPMARRARPRPWLPRPPCRCAGLATCASTHEVDERRPNVVGMPKAELESALVELGMKPFVARQVWRWLYTQGATSFAAMHNVSKRNRALLAFKARSILATSRPLRRSVRASVSLGPTSSTVKVRRSSLHRPSEAKL